MTENLSQQERLARIYRIRVWYPRMKFIYDEIVRAFEINPLTPDPECIALLGQFRTGKTTRNYPRSGGVVDRQRHRGARF